MLKMSLLLPVVLFVFTQAASACDDNLYEQFPTTRQGSDDYWADAYGYVPHQQPFNFPYYQQQNDFVPSGITIFKNLKIPRNFQISFQLFYCRSRYVLPGTHFAQQTEIQQPEALEKLFHQ